MQNGEVCRQKKAKIMIDLFREDCDNAPSRYFKAEPLRVLPPEQPIRVSEILFAARRRV